MEVQEVEKSSAGVFPRMDQRRHEQLRQPSQPAEKSTSRPGRPCGLPVRQPARQPARKPHGEFVFCGERKRDEES